MSSSSGSSGSSRTRVEEDVDMLDADHDAFADSLSNLPIDPDLSSANAQDYSSGVQQGTIEYNNWPSAFKRREVQEQFAAPPRDPAAELAAEFRSRYTRAEALQKRLDEDDEKLFLLNGEQGICYDEREVKQQAHGPVYGLGCDTAAGDSKKPGGALSGGFECTPGAELGPIEQEDLTRASHEKDSQTFLRTLGQKEWAKWNAQRTFCENIEEKLQRLHKKDEKDDKELQRMLDREAIIDSERIQLAELSQYPPEFQTDEENELRRKLQAKADARERKQKRKEQEEADRWIRKLEGERNKQEKQTARLLEVQKALRKKSLADDTKTLAPSSTAGIPESDFTKAVKHLLYSREPSMRLNEPAEEDLLYPSEGADPPYMP